MSGDTVQISAEWAVEGKQPGSHDDYGILACSQGQLGHRDFAKIRTRYGTGTPEELPQVTIAWVGGGEHTRLVLAIQKWSDQEDRTGRRIAVTRYFCVPYAQVTQHPVSYEALYLAFDGCELPMDDPLTVSVPALDPEDIAARAGGTAIGAAALLLTDQPVCIVRGESVPLLDRLRFLDTVAALLPYGMRTKLTASTWTSSTSEHKIRLSFTKHVPDGTRPVIWGCLADIPSRDHDACHYLDLLIHCSQPTELIGWLAAATEPLSFHENGRSRAVTLLTDFGLAPRGGFELVPNNRYAVERLLNECADILQHGQSPGLGSLLENLDTIIGKRGGAFTEDEQIRYRKLIRERRLLSGKRGLAELLEASLHRVVLAVGYGPRLTVGEMNQIFQDVSIPTRLLLTAMWRMPASEPIVSLTLACDLGDEALAQTLQSQQTKDLVEVAAGEPYDSRLIRVICEELVKRGTNGAEDPTIAEALREHRYLTGAIRALHPNKGELQFERLCSLLKAAYGLRLDRKAFEEIAGYPPGLHSAPLLAAAVVLYGPGVGNVLLQTSIVDFLHDARLSPMTLGRVQRLLFDPVPDGPAPDGPAPGRPAPDPKSPPVPETQIFGRRHKLEHGDDQHGRPQSPGPVGRFNSRGPIPAVTLYGVILALLALVIVLTFMALSSGGG